MTQTAPPSPPGNAPPGQDSQGGHRRLMINALAAVCYTAAQTVVGLGVYAFLIRTLGAEEVGIWVSLMALGMLTCMSDLALNQALIRQVALSRVAPVARTAETVETLFTATVVLTGMGFGLLYATQDLWLPWLKLSDQSTALAHTLVPYLCVGLWCNRLSDALGGALEGMQRYVPRSLVGIGSFVCGLILTVLLVPTMGLGGAALAFCLQNAFQFLGNWFLLNQSSLGIRWVRPRIQGSLLKESVRYGLSVQGLVLAYALLENGSKLLMVRSGYLSAASYFDMAFRIGKGLRVLLSSALRVLVPRIVSQMHIEGQQQSIYTQSFLLVTAIAVPMYMGLLATSDVLSWVLIGHVDRQFMWAVALALCPWLAYCFIDPALNTAMAQGHMRWAVLGHGLKVVLALALLGVPLFHDSATGMYAAVAMAMVGGSAVMLWMAHRQQAMPWSALTPSATVPLMLLTLCVGLWGVLDTSAWQPTGPGWHTGARVLTLMLMPVGVLWWHPGGQRLLGLLRRLCSRPAPEARA